MTTVTINTVTGADAGQSTAASLDASLDTGATPSTGATLAAATSPATSLATGATPAVAAPATPQVAVSFNLNGEKTCWQGDPARKLLDLLRDDLGQVGVKCGCREGECGACSVLLDGRLVNSCLIAAGRVDGAEVVTIEGLRDSERFQILDRCFAAHSAVQCGYCIPGMVLAAEALLSRNPHPTVEDVRAGISGNLCRCTGYNAIVDAIIDASKEGEGLW